MPYSKLGPIHQEVRPKQTKQELIKSAVVALLLFIEIVMPLYNSLYFYRHVKEKILVSFTFSIFSLHLPEEKSVHV